MVGGTKWLLRLEGNTCSAAARQVILEQLSSKPYE
jgi:hypothetical protein